MSSAVKLREHYSAKELRVLARRSKKVNQGRRLLSLAGMHLAKTTCMVLDLFR
jgi:hypothetical protein